MRRRILNGSEATSKRYPQAMEQLYRAGMLMGRAPADVHKVDAASWMNNRGYFGYYTEAEREKIETAFKELGLKPETLIEPGSQEPPGVNNVSPVRGFGGYPR